MRKAQELTTNFRIAEKRETICMMKKPLDREAFRNEFLGKKCFMAAKQRYPQPQVHRQ